MIATARRDEAGVRVDRIAAVADIGRVVNLDIARQQIEGGLVFGLGLLAAAAQAAWHFTLIRQRSREGCFTAFRQNHWLGFAVFAGVALDLALR